MINKDARELFLDYLSFEKGLAKNTTDNYEKDLENFFKYFNDKNYKEITKEDVLFFLEYNRKKYKRNTVLRKVTSVRSFYNFMLKNYDLENIPTENLVNLKRENYIPEILTVSEIKDILNAIDTSLKGQRDRMILKLLIATGGRVSEILEIKMKDIDLEGFQYLKVIGKGSKTRLIPIYDEVSRELREYIENVRNKLVEIEMKKIEKNKIKNIDIEFNEHHLVFFGMKRQNFWRKLKIYAKNAGIKKNVYPHIFRHSIATEMLRNGADIRIVQELLGHKSIATTEIYTHLNKRELKKVYDNIGIGD